MNTDTPPILVVGSGPSGVSCARALLDAGVPVIMVDAGVARLEVPAADRPTLAELRTQYANGANPLLGAKLDALRVVRDLSPKIRTAATAEFLSGYVDRNKLNLNNFDLVGTLSQGGLSNVWGAGVSTFDDSDLEKFPITYDDLEHSYRVIAERIGISGSASDDLAGFHGGDLALQPPLSLLPAMANILDAYERQPKRDNFVLGRCRSAVLTEDLGERRGCSEDMMCMWGCSRRSIYNAADDLAELMGRPGFTIHSGCIVHKIERAGDEYTLLGRDANGKPVTLQAPQVVLAAGTLASTRLVLELLDRVDKPLPLLNNPSMAMAFWSPSRMGKPLSDSGFGMAQLSFRQQLTERSQEYCFGLLFAAETFAASDLVLHMPFSRRGAMRILRPLLSGLVLGFVYFPSEFSRNHVCLRRTVNGGSVLDVEGGYHSDLIPTARDAAKRVAKRLRTIGVWQLPGSTKIYPPGAEVHYGGTLAMGSVTSKYCEVIGAEGLFVVDGSVLSSLPAKQHTLTMMANADRIGRHLAERYHGHG